MIKLALLREGKVPIDRRVPLTPKQCVEVMKLYPNVEIVVQPSEIRGYVDEEYSKLGIKLQKDVNDCDILMGVKEVNIQDLIPNKKYMFFSHTSKKQSYNQKLLKALVEKNIQIIDYEYLKNTHNQRVVAFGRYAGIVGAYNSLLAYGKRLKSFDLMPAHKCFDMKAMFEQLSNVKLKKTKILITGGGRVAMGAMETLDNLNLKVVSPEDFLTKEFNHPVICQIDADVYTKRKDGEEFEFQHFFSNPDMYESTFKPFTKVADIYIASHFWDPRSPEFITKDIASDTEFNIKVIADISCDIAKPIVSTLRPSTVDDPLYGYNPKTGKEEDAFADGNITVMAVDNLPCELPRDSSKDFGDDLIKEVLPSLLNNDTEKMIEKASITKDGKLTEYFSYLSDYLAGK